MQPQCDALPFCLSIGAQDAQVNAADCGAFQMLSARLYVEGSPCKNPHLLILLGSPPPMLREIAKSLGATKAK